jgi:outer membrane protein TolC
VILAAIALASACRAEPIDLPTVVRLAGGQNLDVQLAREKVNEARAAAEAARWQFFPGVTPGIGYKAHNGTVQTVEGRMIETDKQSYTIGPAIGIQLDLGDAIYKRLAAKQLTKAAEHGAEARRQQSVLEAVQCYFDLCKAKATITVTEQSLAISKEYKQQIASGVTSGVAFKGDELRAETQVQKYELLLKQAEQARRVASAQLKEILRLDGLDSLQPSAADLVPMSLPEGRRKKEDLVRAALAARPETRQAASAMAAAQEGVRGAKVGPLIPTIGASVFGGGVGGGIGSDAGDFGGSADYQITLGWRIGPGGLFDRPRQRAAESRAAQVGLIQQQTHDRIVQEVVASYESVKLLREQVEIARKAVAAAQQTLELARGRREFAVGVVLETLQAEQDATRARLDLATTIAELNKAQYRLRAAAGEDAGK